jgi:hypothetical protein
MDRKEDARNTKTVFQNNLQNLKGDARVSGKMMWRMT